MKRSELFFNFLFLPLDFLGIILAGIFSYFLRFKTSFFEDLPTFFLWNFKEYLSIIILIGLFLILIFILTGLYSLKEKRSLWTDFLKIFTAVSAGIMGIVIYIFFKKELFTSRFLILSLWLFSIIFVFSLRAIYGFILKTFYKYGLGIRKIALIGNNPTAFNLEKEISQNISLGYKVSLKTSGSLEEVINKLKDFLKKERIDELIQAEANFSREEILKLIDFCEENNIVFKFAPDLFESRVLHTQTETLNGIPLVELKRTPLDGWGRIVKRIIDILGSVFFITLFSPIMLLMTIAIKIDTPGPVFFVYKRVGKYGKPFTYFKFRSMKHGLHYLRFSKEWQEKNLRKGTPMIKFKDDPRITRTGKFIRRYSLDEFSEFFLVLIGKMSLVGPRAHEIEEVESYQKHHRKVLTIKPGITGLAQISGRSDLNFEEEVRLDIFYIENWSLWLDFYILLKTPLAVLKKREAL